MEWGLTGPSHMSAVRGGFARATLAKSLQPYAISYLTAPAIGKVESESTSYRVFEKMEQRLSSRPAAKLLDPRRCGPRVGIVLPTMERRS